MNDIIVAGKIAAARRCVDDMIGFFRRTIDDNSANISKQNHFVVGIGSGTTIIHAMDHLVKRLKGIEFEITCIPTSFQARRLILDSHLALGSLEQYPVLDIAIDGADEVDRDLNLIKGGGGCMMQEKIVASCAKNFFVIADDRKDTVMLGSYWKKGIPVEVLPISYTSVQMKVQRQLGGVVELRMADRKAGPVVTDNGNFIVDWRFEGCPDWTAADCQLHCIPGVLETGLFCSNMVSRVYFGTSTGEVYVKPHYSSS